MCLAPKIIFYFRGRSVPIDFHDWSEILKGKQEDENILKPTSNHLDTLIIMTYIMNKNDLLKI